MRARLILVLLAVWALAACSGASGESGGSTPDPTTASPTAPAAASATSSPTPSSVEVAEPDLPAIQPVAQAGGTAIDASTEADWALVAFGRAWISGLGEGVGVYDASTGRLRGSVDVPQGPCAATTSGFGAVWTATCDTPGIARIDPATARVTGHLPLPVPVEGETSIGAGEGAVWAIADGADCTRCLVSRIDPTKLRVTDEFPLSFDATAVRAGRGGVWVTSFSRNSVVRLDPSSGAVVATIAVASGPRFLDVGAGGVWVMAQTDGALCRIDPDANRLVGCTVIDPSGVQGGDLTVGDGFVWFRGSEALVAQVDPQSGQVVRRIGPGEGSGSAAAGAGQLWISAHDVAKLYRVPVFGSRG